MRNEPTVLVNIVLNSNNGIRLLSLSLFEFINFLVPGNVSEKKRKNERRKRKKRSGKTPDPSVGSGFLLSLQIPNPGSSEPFFQGRAETVEGPEAERNRGENRETPENRGEF